MPYKYGEMWERSGRRSLRLGSAVQPTSLAPFPDSFTPGFALYYKIS